MQASPTRLFMEDEALVSLRTQIEALRAHNERLRVQPPQDVVDFASSPLAKPGLADVTMDTRAEPEAAAGATAAASDPMAALEDFFASLNLPPPVLVPEDQHSGEEAGSRDGEDEAEPPPSHLSAALTAAERSQQYDALVRGMVQRAWSSAVQEYRSGSWIARGASSGQSASSGLNASSGLSATAQRYADVSPAPPRAVNGEADGAEPWRDACANGAHAQRTPTTDLPRSRGHGRRSSPRLPASSCRWAGMGYSEQARLRHDVESRRHG